MRALAQRGCAVRMGGMEGVGWAAAARAREAEVRVAAGWGEGGRALEQRGWAVRRGGMEGEGWVVAPWVREGQVRVALVERKEGRGTRETGLGMEAAAVGTETAAAVGACLRKQG